MYVHSSPQSITVSQCAAPSRRSFPEAKTSSQSPGETMVAGKTHL